MFSRLRAKVSSLFAGVVLWLKFRPSYYTVIGLMLSFVYIVMMYYDLIALALLFMFLSGLMDVFDGLAARLVYKPTRYGAFIDSVIDRVEDGVYVIGLLFLGLNKLLVFIALTLTLMIPYISLRASSLDLNKNETSVMERSDRIIILALTITAYMFLEGLGSFLLLPYIALALYNVIYNVVSYSRSNNAVVK